jgi:HEAT repeat protein
MTPQAVVLAIGAVQMALVVAFVLLLAGNRVRTRRRTARAGVGEVAVTAAFQQWLLEEAPVDAVKRALRDAPPDTALEQLVLAMSTRVPAERQATLVQAVRGDWWVRDILARGLAWRWTDRLRTARLLSAVAGPQDEAVVRRLLQDAHPAVRAAVVPAIARVGTATLVSSVLNGLSRQATAVRYLVGAVLLQSRQALVAALAERFTHLDAPERDLAAWIELVIASRDPTLLAVASRLSTHEKTEVRTAAVRALAQWFHPEAPVRLRERLTDVAAPVRALAARGLGALGDREAVPLLVNALADRDWWVRFRSALALALLGDDGRAALRRMSTAGDRYAADMARMVSGLPSGVLRELAES